MDIFEILREAKNPSSPKPQTITAQEDDSSSDYAADVEKENDTDDTQEDQTDEENTGDESEEDSETTDNENDDDTDSEDVDYTADVDSDNSDAGEDSGEASSDEDGENGEENTEQSPEDQEDAKRNALLIKNCITMYYSMKSAVDKLSKVNNLSIVTNKINIQVKQNLSELMDQLYDLITAKFSNNSYVKNLYTYNYFIEAYKINIEMLRKNEQFQ